MIRIRPLIACGALAGLLACSEGSKVEPVQPDRPANFKLENPAAQITKGELIEATHVVSFSKTEVHAKLTSIYSALQAASPGLDAVNGVHIYKVKYQSQTPTTPPQAIVASGLILIPDNKTEKHPWISVQHGTIVGKADAPSVSPGEGLFEASQGFVTLVPDYLGFGAASQVFHPYLIAQAYADAGVDLLTAAYKFASNNSIAKGPLFLKGYSEGGYATLALQKEIELNHPEFPLYASAPSAGPYDIDQTANELLRKPTVNPINLTFVVLSYVSWLANKDFNPAAVLQPPMETLQKLFIGAANNDVVARSLPEETDKLIKPELLKDFLSAQPKINESIKLHSWLQAQSLTNKDWKPAKPTYFWHCVDDEVVPFSASDNAAKVFAAPHVTLIPIASPSPEQKFTHGNCPAIFLPTVKFVDALKQTAAQ